MNGTYLEYNSAEVSDLIVRCQSGNRHAFDELVSRYQRYVFNLIYQHLGRTDDLEDVAQEVFLRIYKFIRKYRGNASLESWIYKIVLNYCRTHARRRSTWQRIFGIQASSARADDERSYEVLDTLPSETYDPAKTVEQRRVAEDILDAVHSLPDIYRDILIMREVNELSYEEIAQILTISIGTVKSRISRARDLVRAKVKL
ncbi:sigma-70 family RNA polymerase sigma factor [bacterium]|nr:sigma-70 family RNA polymerase sigma factor [bacterium]